MKVVLLIFMVLIAPSWNFQDDDEWIDPTDMLNYDAASGKMVNRPQGSTEQTSVKSVSSRNVQTDCQSQVKEYVERFENLKVQMEEYKKKAQEKGSQCGSNPIFRRYLLKILGEVRQLGLPDEANPEVHYDAEVFLTRHMFAEIEKFLNDADWSVGALDEALSRTLVNFKPHNEEEWRWEFEDYVGVDAFTLFMILLCLLCVVSMIATELWTHIGWYTQIKRICILSIIISFGWNWLYLYKVAFAERQAEMAKMKTYDDNCREKTNWVEGLFDWMKSSITFKNDPCEEYYKALLINPALMVPPTKALALTFTNFVTEPLKHIGKGLGEFISSLLSEIPVLLQIPVLIFMAIALMALCYGTGSSIGQINRVRYLPGPDQGRYHAVEHQMPNPPLPAQERNQERYLPPPQWRERNHMHVQFLQAPENLEPIDTIDSRAMPLFSKEKKTNEETESKMSDYEKQPREGSNSTARECVSEISTAPVVESLKATSKNSVSLPKEMDSIEESKGNGADIQSNVALNGSPRTPETKPTICSPVISTSDTESPNVETLACNIRIHKKIEDGNPEGKCGMHEVKCKMATMQ
ncbi:chloride channel CLIC-like protein 1 isoform X1 [Pelobates fuscus]|uniref:chloride channel CLIC-like protein 1 isoform X1 n=1 Tax=Pelobates fuscus TaxID=191477 RepID=UPI002FE4CB60